MVIAVLLVRRLIGPMAARTPLLRAQQFEQRLEIADLLARCRRGAADEIEDLAVLQSVVGEAGHLTVIVEINRDHALIDDRLLHEGDLPLRALRDVIKHLAVQCRDSGGGAHHDQHLILACADLDLLERAGWQDVALLEGLAGAAGHDRAHQRGGERRAQAMPSRRGGSGRLLRDRYCHSRAAFILLHRARG